MSPPGWPNYLHESRTCSLPQSEVVEMETNQNPGRGLYTDTALGQQQECSGALLLLFLGGRWIAERVHELANFVPFLLNSFRRLFDARVVKAYLSLGQLRLAELTVRLGQAVVAFLQLGVE